MSASSVFMRRIRRRRRGGVPRPRSAARLPGRRPEQIAASPSPPPLRRSSWIIVPRMRPPLAPIGWPSATAPPFTFAVSGSAPSIFDRVERDRRERLVHLDALDVADRLARLRERLRAGVRGRAREPRELVGDVALRDDRRERLEPPALRELLRAHDDARRAVVHARRVAGGDRPFGIHDRLERGELLERRVAADALVRRRPRRPARSRRRRAPRPAPSRRARASGSPSRPAPRARCRARGRRRAACCTMCCSSKVERRPSQIIRSTSVAVAHLVAEARLRQRVRRVRHRLHAARDDDLDVAGADHRVGDLDRADRRRAHLVDRVRRAPRSAARRRSPPGARAPGPPRPAAPGP